MLTITPSTRRARSAIVACALVLALAALAGLDLAARDGVEPGRMALGGLAVGLIVAAGGAWREARPHGVDPIRLFRGASVTVLVALALSRLADSYLVAGVGAVGCERALLEAWRRLARRRP